MPHCFSQIYFNSGLPLRQLCHLVELQSELALLVSGVVLVKDSLGNSLVNLLYSSLVCFCSGSLVAGFNSSVVLLYNSAKLTLEHLVLESLCRNNLYTLFSGLNVRHSFYSLQFFTA